MALVFKPKAFHQCETEKLYPTVFPADNLFQRFQGGRFAGQPGQWPSGPQQTGLTQFFGSMTDLIGLALAFIRVRRAPIRLDCSAWTQFP